MTFGISWSSTFFRSAALIWPLSRFARASVIAGGAQIAADVVGAKGRLGSFHWDRLLTRSLVVLRWTKHRTGACQWSRRSPLVNPCSRQAAPCRCVGQRPVGCLPSPPDREAAPDGSASFRGKMRRNAAPRSVPLACDGSGFRPTIRAETGRAREAPVHTIWEGVSMIKRVLMASAALALSAALAQAQEVKIGLVAPFTGIGAELGQQIDRGVRAVSQAQGRASSSPTRSRSSSATTRTRRAPTPRSRCRSC